jgi:hypothetical protein
MLVGAYGQIPSDALAKAQTAYGQDIQRKVAWVVNKLRDGEELSYAAEILQMDADKASGAISILRNESIRIWPDAAISAKPADPLK